MRLDTTNIVSLALLGLARSCFGATAGIPRDPFPFFNNIHLGMARLASLGAAVQMANAHFHVPDGRFTGLRLWSPELEQELHVHLRHPRIALVELGRNRELTLFGIPWRPQRPHDHHVVMMFWLSEGRIAPVGFADFVHRSVPDRATVFWSAARDRGELLTLVQAGQRIRARP